MKKRILSDKDIPKVELHYVRQRVDELHKVVSSKDAEQIIRPFFNRYQISYKEFFFCVLLDNIKQVVGVAHIGTGTQTTVAIELREIVQLAVLAHAKAVILVHNHPSGGLKPSDRDIDFTTRVKKALSVFDIELVDHLILSRESYVSFNDQNIASL